MPPAPSFGRRRLPLPPSLAAAILSLPRWRSTRSGRTRDPAVKRRIGWVVLDVRLHRPDALDAAGGPRSPPSSSPATPPPGRRLASRSSDSRSIAAVYQQEKEGHHLNPHPFPAAPTSPRRRREQGVR